LSIGKGNSAARLEKIFLAFKEEEPSARSKRWMGEFDRITKQPRPIVLFGAGDLGQYALKRLRRANSQPCCFSDNNEKSWGTSIEGIEVLSPTDAVARYGDIAAFIVTVFNGSAARTQLRQMGCSYVLSAKALFWKYPQEFMPECGIDTPDLLVEQEPQIRECFALLADETSRQELCDQLIWRYWLEPEFLPSPRNAEKIYFPSDLVRPVEREVLVDCGAFDGDSIRSFFKLGRSFDHVYALEPDPGSRAALQAFLMKQGEDVSDRVTVWPYAVSNEDGEVSFVVTGTAGSTVTKSGQGQTMECRKLDSLPWAAKPTYIKMDIESSEPKGLAGGAHLIQQQTPVMAVCLYHRSDHLWQIPLLIHSIEPRYSLFLRRYAEDCWEQICYAVPPNRLVQS
jgi:FkbM family methyltransferase